MNYYRNLGISETTEKLFSFIQGIQKGSPVDAHVLPEPRGMPGYNDEVIIAAGTFVSGATRLSADAPIREPYVGYGLTLKHRR